MCIELAASGDLANEDEMRAALMALTARVRRRRRVPARHGLPPPSSPGGVRHGLDADPHARSSTSWRALAGVGDRSRRSPKSAMRGELDFQASFRKRVALLKGLPASALQQVVDSVPLMDGAERLIDDAAEAGLQDGDPVRRLHVHRPRAAAPSRHRLPARQRARHRRRRRHRRGAAPRSSTARARRTTSRRSRGPKG